MAEDPKKWLDRWINTYIYAEGRTPDEIEEVMDDLLRDAQESGISAAELDKAADGSVRSHILTILRKIDNG